MKHLTTILSVKLHVLSYVLTALHMSMRTKYLEFNSSLSLYILNM